MIQTIPARRGKAARLQAGQAIKIINTHGTQVVDFWAFLSSQPTEYVGMEQSRPTWLHMYPKTGQALYTNRRRPLLWLEEDTSPGRHDTLMAPCDNERYGLLGCTEYHDNCRDNMHGALAEIGMHVAHTPASLNLFMNIPWNSDGDLSFDPALSKPGDYVVLRAAMDCVAVMSSCPQDILMINSQAPTEAHFEILD